MFIMVKLKIYLDRFDLILSFVTSSLHSNNLYINPNTYVNDWMASHPCVIYLGEIKPTLPKGAKSFDIL